MIYIKNIVVIICIFIFQNCENQAVKDYIYGKSTNPKHCELDSGVFIEGKHYVSSEFMTENNEWNYQRLQEYHRRKVQSIPQYECIPITPKINLHEMLIEKEKFIDLMK